MTAFCGLDCGRCPAYLATRNDDPELRRDTAKRWSALFQSQIRPEEINCLGCQSDSGVLFGHCLVCGIRRCAADKGLANCAGCGVYPCPELEPIHKYAPEAKKALDRLRVEP